MNCLVCNSKINIDIESFFTICRKCNSNYVHDFPEEYFRFQFYRNELIINITYSHYPNSCEISITTLEAISFRKNINIKYKKINSNVEEVFAFFKFGYSLANKYLENIIFV
jgi:hypothetical protein